MINIYYQFTKNCNYKCDYCVSHNKIDKAFTNKDIWTKICNFINELYNKTNALGLNIYGGEPTLHPDFLDIIKNLNDNIKYELFTNMSASLDLYDEFIYLRPKCSISASIHPRHMNVDDFIYKLEYLLNKHKQIHITIYCGIDNIYYPNKLDVDEINKKLHEILTSNRCSMTMFPIVYSGNSSNINIETNNKNTTIVNSVKINYKNIDVSNCFTNKAVIDPSGYIYQCVCAPHRLPLLDITKSNAINKYFKLINEMSNITCKNETCCYKGNRHTTNEIQY